MASTVKVGMEIHGLKPVLTTLMYIDRDLYNATTKEIKMVAQPLVAKVKGDFPAVVLSGFMKTAATSERKGGPFPSYKIGKVRQGVSAKVGGRRNTYTGAWPILRISQRNAGAMVFDMAQKQQTPGKTFVANLKKEGYGDASRVMWKSVRRNMGMVQKNVENAVAKVERSIEGQLSRNLEKSNAQSRVAASQTRTQGRFGLN
jgi:hypothetical protein